MMLQPKSVQGVKDIRAVMGEAGKNIMIISKIENLQGVNNIDEIIAESDGIMVARGDMGKSIFYSNFLEKKSLSFDIISKIF